MTQRTDIHSPSNIDPTQYAVAIDYVGAREGEPAINVPEAVELYREHGAYIHGGIFQCDVCGSHFRTGTLYRHIPTGELIALGHQCADKLDFAVNTDARNLLSELRHQAGRRRFRRAALRKFVASSSGALLRALRADHHITRDIRRKLIEHAGTYGGSLTEKQEHLILKLARDVRERAARKAELDARPKAVALGEDAGRVTVEGTVVATKVTDWGTKLIVEFQDEAGGYWAAYGSYPRVIEEALWSRNADRTEAEPFDIRGTRVRFAATFQRSDRDEGFAFFKRPTKAEVVAWPEVQEAGSIS